MSDKTRPVDGGEKVVVRGPLQVENLQRLKLIFPKQTEGVSLQFESVDGYLERVAWTSEGGLQVCASSLGSPQCATTTRDPLHTVAWPGTPVNLRMARTSDILPQLCQLVLLVPHEDDVRESCFSRPFGDEHPSPADHYHHHNSYSKIFHVEPMSAEGLIGLAGADRSFKLPAGSLMEQTLFGIAEVTGLAAIIAGTAEVAADVGVAVAGGAAVAEVGAGAAAAGAGVAAAEGAGAVAAGAGVAAAEGAGAGVAAAEGAAAAAEGAAEAAEGAAAAAEGALADGEGAAEAGAEVAGEEIPMDNIAANALKKKAAAGVVAVTGAAAGTTAAVLAAKKKGASAAGAPAADVPSTRGVFGLRGLKRSPRRAAQ